MTLHSIIEGWKQLAFADHIVLTKTDLADEPKDWVRELKLLNPAAHFHDKHDADFKIADLFDGLNARYSPVLNNLKT
jgi:G3E family GTPase